MLDHGPHPPRLREKKRNPWHQHVHRATRPRSYAIDKVWEAVTSSCKQYGGVKNIICYLCFMQHAWSCYFFFPRLLSETLPKFCGPLVGTHSQILITDCSDCRWCFVFWMKLVLPFPVSKYSYVGTYRRTPVSAVYRAPPQKKLENQISKRFII